MHTLHFFAVEADGIQEAFEKVYNALEESPLPWSDWHVVGGGRWNSDPSKQYQDSDNDIVRYPDNKEKFHDMLDSVSKYRTEQVERLALHSDLDAIKVAAVDYIVQGGKDDFWDAKNGMQLWSIKRAIEMMQGEYGPDSMFFDLASGSTSMKYLMERLDTSPDNQYLVPVDLHY